MLMLDLGNLKAKWAQSQMSNMLYPVRRLGLPVVTTLCAILAPARLYVSMLSAVNGMPATLVVQPLVVQPEAAKKRAC